MKPAHVKRFRLDSKARVIKGKPNTKVLYFVNDSVSNLMSELHRRGGDDTKIRTRKDSFYNGKAKGKYVAFMYAKIKTRKKR